MDSGSNRLRGDHDKLVKTEIGEDEQPSDGPPTDILFENGMQDSDIKYTFRPILNLGRFFEEDDLLECSSRFSPNSQSTNKTARSSVSSTSTYQHDGDEEPLMVQITPPTTRSSGTSSDFTNLETHTSLGSALDDSVFKEEREVASSKPKTWRGKGGVGRNKNQHAAGGAADCDSKKDTGGGKKRAPKRVMQKKPKVPITVKRVKVEVVPDEEKDDAYWARRNRNTNAARRCRAKKLGLSPKDDPFEMMMTARGIDEKQKVRFRQIRGRFGELFMKVFDTAVKANEESDC